MKAVLVTGGRNYANMNLVRTTLDAVNPDFLIEGGCPTGADKHARNWAEDRGVHHATVPALWNKLGKSAGPARNSVMVMMLKALEGAGMECTVFAFPGGSGTESCVTIATDNEFLVRCVEDPR
jgi:hypothetical protein